MTNSAAAVPSRGRDRSDGGRGDVIVLGTDVLLDNVYPSEMEVLLDLMEEEGIELDAEQLARRIAEMALENSQDVEFCSPFELNAHKSGFVDFAGGKIDDITLLPKINALFVKRLRKFWLLH